MQKYTEFPKAASAIATIPMNCVKEEADLLAQDDAELDTFVAGLFKSGDELHISGEAPSKLIPAIVQAFEVRSALVNFRPLSISYEDGLASLYTIWPDAAHRLIRPCPFCMPVFEQDDASTSIAHVTDRYHIRNVDSGQQLTVEVLQRCLRPERDGEPVEYWTRVSIIDSARILVDDGARCRPELPNQPQRVLVLPYHGYLLLEVFGFASRDDLDALQLTCKSWRNIVDNAAGTLALRPLECVFMNSQKVTIRRTPVSERMPGASFHALWDQIPGYRPEEFRPEDVPIFVSLLRHVCALNYVWDGVKHFCPLTQHLSDNGRTFRAKAVTLQFLDKDEVITSLPLVEDMGTKDFELGVQYGDVAPLIFGNEALLSMKRFLLLIGRTFHAITGPELSDIQEHCHAFLRTAVGCHVLFFVHGSYALFSCDHVIERFLAASRSDDFSMPLSLQMHVLFARQTLKPASCNHATLRDVTITQKVLPRCFIYREELTFDVFHFRNQRIDEWLTVCLGKNQQGIVYYVFLQKRRIMTSLEDIAKMTPISYE